MQMFYGPVPIKVSRLLGHEAEAVYDASNTDYLFTRHIISVEGLVGRNTVMYKMVPDFTAVGPVPMVWNGIGNAIESVAAIRHALSQPRQPLLLFTGPQPDFLNAAAKKPAILIYCNGLDANNGPRPLEPVSIQSVHGDGNLAFIRFTVQLEINECPLVSSLSNKPPTPDPFAAYNLRLLSVAGLPVLLSNRYSSSIIYSGEDESVTYRYSGRATFRSDALQRIAGLASVDQFRGSLLPPPVVNCRREIKHRTYAVGGFPTTPHKGEVGCRATE